MPGSGASPPVTAASRNRVPATRVQDVPIRDTTGAHRGSWSTPLGAKRDPGDNSRAAAGRARLPRPVSGTRGGWGGTHPRQAPPTDGPREGAREGKAASAPGDRLPGDRSVTPVPTNSSPQRLGLAPSARGRALWKVPDRPHQQTRSPGARRQPPLPRTRRSKLRQTGDAAPPRHRGRRAARLPGAAGTLPGSPRPHVIPWAGRGSQGDACHIKAAARWRSPSTPLALPRDRPPARPTPRPGGDVGKKKKNHTILPALAPTLGPQPRAPKNKRKEENQRRAGGRAGSGRESETNHGKDGGQTAEGTHRPLPEKNGRKREALSPRHTDPARSTTLGPIDTQSPPDRPAESGGGGDRLRRDRDGTRVTKHTRIDPAAASRLGLRSARAAGERGVDLWGLRIVGVAERIKGWSACLVSSTVLSAGRFASPVRRRRRRRRSRRRACLIFKKKKKILSEGRAGSGRESRTNHGRTEGQTHTSLRTQGETSGSFSET